MITETELRTLMKSGGTRMSTLAAMRGENPPGTRRKRQLARRRRDMAKKSRKQNRK